MSYAKFIESLKVESATDVVKHLSVSELQSKLDMLELYWGQFEEQHLKLLSGKDCSEVLEHDYIKKQVYDHCLLSYSSARTVFIGIIKALDESVDMSESFYRRPAQSASTGQISQRPLPKISLPSFSGDFPEWTPFKDLFISMVVDNNNLSAVEKLHYLLTFLTGEPRKMIFVRTLYPRSSKEIPL
ncbi:uncharacterized protein [Fopius arisanus]|uniref:Uncharacterized protein n=1 Tax=Fopius arisanus TaxID=64838 RepID=A0A9R1U9D9_9HYME|nr:PREDICTED: uncharacterized protein LOC105272663 [Fopius arisanus]